ncbi:hypothetical protein [Aneurinibacillus sp. REN35]|uniref:hypothetical protein n=1 Tax=Aneurinibacillus sp. REN35 TaxID=3237286 RepID=UPI003527AF1D
MTLNTRLVPGLSPYDVMEQIKKVIDDPSIEVKLATDMSEEEAKYACSSSAKTKKVRVIQ